MAVTHAASRGETPAGSAETPAGSPTAVQERQRLRQPYPNFRVIVLDDDVNTFQHVVDCLVRHLPAMQMFPIVATFAPIPMNVQQCARPEKY